MKINLKIAFLSIFSSNHCESGADEKFQFEEKFICGVENMGGPQAPCSELSAP